MYRFRFLFVILASFTLIQCKTAEREAILYYQPEGLTPKGFKTIGYDKCIKALKRSRSKNAKEALEKSYCGNSSDLKYYLSSKNPLSSYTRLAYARSLYRGNKLSGLKNVLEGVGLPGVSGLEIKYLKARSYIEKSKWKNAYKLLLEALEVDEKDLNLSYLLGSYRGNSHIFAEEVYYYLAYASERMGYKEKSLALYQYIWANFPESQFRKEVESKVALGKGKLSLKQVVFNMDDVKSQTYYKLFIKRALAYFRLKSVVSPEQSKEYNKRFKGILSILQKRLSKKDRLWSFKIAEAYYGFGWADTGLSFVKKSGESPFSNKAFKFIKREIRNPARFLYNYVFGLYRVKLSKNMHDSLIHENKEFSKFKKLAKSKKISDKKSFAKFLDKTSYKKAFLLYDFGNGNKGVDKSVLREAIVNFKRHLREFPNTEYQEWSRWFLSWSYILINYKSKAVPYLKDIVKLKRDNLSEAGAKYWLAKIRKSRFDLKKVSEYYPGSVYGKLVSPRQKYFSTPQKISFKNISKLGVLTPVLKSIATLAQTGYIEWAKELYYKNYDLVSRLRKRNVILEVSHYLQKQDLYNEGVMLVNNKLSNLCSKNIKKLNYIELTACYPRPYRSIVEKKSRGSDSISPALMYSMMRQESMYDSQPRSWVGARGILQMMPQTALMQHEKTFKNKFVFQRKWLNYPPYNISLSIAHVGDLFKQYRKISASLKVPYVLAAYNAGTGNVRRWMRKKNADKLDYYIENIGFGETRNYVKKIMGNIATYNYIYGYE